MNKFRAIPLHQDNNIKRADEKPWEPASAAAIASLPTGDQVFWGIPFDMGPTNNNEVGLVVAGASGTTDAVNIGLGGKASHVIIAHVCDSRASSSTAGQTADYPIPVVTAPGELLANYVLMFADGTEKSVPIRRRFEITQVLSRMQNAFSARQHQDMETLDFRGPYPADLWGRMQTGVSVGSPLPAPAARDYLAQNPGSNTPSWSIYALPNLFPEREIVGLRIEPTGSAAIAIGGVTLFYGDSHPLRLNVIESIALDGPNKLDNRVSVDMGIIARTRTVPNFDPDKWLAAPVKGWGELSGNDKTFVADVVAASDATLTSGDTELRMRDLYQTGKADSKNGNTTARVLTPKRTWVHGRVVDVSTGKPTPARIHFRSPDGRYFPPYGHRHQVNDNWFEDYGADLKMGDTEYAYIDGTYQGEMPGGEVFVEVAKGFEFEPVRERIDIKPGQRNLEIRLHRVANLRTQGWVTADTHVHFLSPETAHLEAQAEGLNLINLLAAQWGDLFTNVGDLTGNMSGSSSNDTIVWVGSENRQHFLGHISMLGAHGQPIFPMSTSGPTEGYFGDPTDRAMSEWADECRRKGGVVIVPHFPFPHSEVVAEVVRGRVDGLEIRDFHGPTLDTFAVHEWYRLLNTGHRVAAVGGTDKKSAGMPVGGVRTYANIGDEEFTFDAWGRAVRAGRTYTTSGPMIDLTVNGLQPGNQIDMPKGGGTVHLEGNVTSTIPIHSLEIVQNGRVIAATTSRSGQHSLALSEEIVVDQSSWLAARCVSAHQAWHCWPVRFGAHTSPVYIVVDRQEFFQEDLGNYLITLMEGGITWLDTLATPSTPERHAAIKRVFEDGISRVSARLSKHTH